MVVGLDKFRSFFAGEEDHYAIIGGSACDIIFDAAGLDFRATKDIDMVICVEVMAPEFAGKFVAFLQAGGYEVYQRSDGKRQFHRFQKPKDAAFPFMIELFSRTPEGFDLPNDAVLAPVPVEDDALSLSAILLDGDYYEALQANRRVEDGVSILDERLLIPFKARAFLDLSERKAAGDRVDQKTIDKHMRDVFRLIQLIPPDERVGLPSAIQGDMARFVGAVADASAFDPKSVKLPFTLTDGLDLIRRIYSI